MFKMEIDWKSSENSFRFGLTGEQTSTFLKQLPLVLWAITPEILTISLAVLSVNVFYYFVNVLWFAQTAIDIVWCTLPRIIQVLNILLDDIYG